MELCDVDWLPTSETVTTRCKAAAVVDLLLCPDPDLRQYRYNSQWAEGISLASRHDGAGSYYYVLRSGTCLVIKVASMRRTMSPDTLAKFQRAPTIPIPALALRILREPEFRYQELSFLAWCEDAQPWQGLRFRVEGEDSLAIGQELLEVICIGPRAFYQYAQVYHEVTLDPTALKALFSLTPIDQALAAKISPQVKLASLGKELGAIGYPVA